MAARDLRGGRLSGVAAGAIGLVVCLALVTLWLRLKSPEEAQKTTAEFTHLNIKTWHVLDELPCELAQFETVFWEPKDTTSLRNWLRTEGKLLGRQVLEIGTGTGIVALCCGHSGAERVIATDINPNAVANARYNAELCGLTNRVEVRQVPRNAPGPFSVLNANEQFDFIMSNPPWEDAAVEELAAHALYDPGFELLDGMLRDGAKYLKPHGRLLLAYGARTAIDRVLRSAPKFGWRARIIDERELETLPEVFVPGMLLELSQNGF